MRLHDEVRPTKEVPSATGKTAKPSKQELDAAVALVEALAGDWEPDKYEDRYRKRLQRIVNKKRKGQAIEVPEGADDQPAALPDLMAALRQALEDAEKGDGRGANKSGGPKETKASA